MEDKPLHPDTDLVADILGQRPDTKPGQDTRPAQRPPTLSPPRQPPVAIAEEERPAHSVRI